MEPRLRGCDALYVNFVTGSEFDLTTALELRRGFRGPIYADIHSLTLATGPSGERSLRPLRDSREWVECFDVVQVNEDELGSIAASEHLDPIRGYATCLVQKWPVRSGDVELVYEGPVTSE